VREGRFVAGVWGGPPEDAARAILHRLLTSLARVESGESAPASSRPRS
jgi:hypothetical protein